MLKIKSKMENIQDEVIKIHHKYGTTEMANYQIQLLFDRNFNQLKTRIKELEGTIENNVTETKIEIQQIKNMNFHIEKTVCCNFHVRKIHNYCPNCGRKIKK